MQTRSWIWPGRPFCKSSNQYANRAAQSRSVFLYKENDPEAVTKAAAHKTVWGRCRFVYGTRRRTFRWLHRRNSAGRPPRRRAGRHAVRPRPSYSSELRFSGYQPSDRLKSNRPAKNDWPKHEKRIAASAGSRSVLQQHRAARYKVVTAFVIESVRTRSWEWPPNRRPCARWCLPPDSSHRRRG